MISLFDYLGRAAGSELGKKVNEYSQIRGAQVSQRYVENPQYKGKIMEYTKEFLDEFFTVQKLFS
jgi:hypothetical protein